MKAPDPLCGKGSGALMLISMAIAIGIGCATSAFLVFLLTRFVICAMWTHS